MAETRFIESFGALPKQIDLRDYKLRKLSKQEISVFPKEFKLEMGVVKNQGFVGSCVAHALSEIVEYHNIHQDNIPDKVSVGFIYGNRRNSTWKKSGMYLRDALDNLHKYGDVFLSRFPENKEVPAVIDLFEKKFDTLKEKAYPNRISSYFALEDDNDIKYSLMHHGPVVFSMRWYSDIKVKNGVIQTEQKKWKSNHCMVIYGWNEEGWLIQNSWGKTWGKSGKAVLPYAVKKNEVWGIIDIIKGENTDIQKPKFWSHVFTWLVEAANWVLNLFRRKN